MVPTPGHAQSGLRQLTDGEQPQLAATQAAAGTGDASRLWPHHLTRPARASSPGTRTDELMQAYRAVWLNTVAILGGIGVLVALLGPRVDVHLVVAVTIGVSVGTLTHLARQVGQHPRQRRQALLATAGATATLLAVIGLVTLGGPVAVLLVALFAVASPPVLRALRIAPRRAPSSSPTSSAPRAGGPPAGDQASTAAERAEPADPDVGDVLPGVRTLSDAELSRAWPASSAELGHAREAGDSVELGRLVVLRQAYLDELERRNPSEFPLWLTGSAHPASDPGELLHRTGPQRPGEDDPRQP